MTATARGEMYRPLRRAKQCLAIGSWGPLVLAVVTGLASPTAHAQGLTALPDIIDRVAPSVVTVATEGAKAPTDEGASAQQAGGNAVFAEALRRIFESQGKSAETKKEGTDAALLEALRKILESQDKSGSAAQDRNKAAVAASQGTSTSAGDAANKDKAKKNQASGMVLSPDGHIVTADFVIDGATSISVTVEGGIPLRAEVIGVDPRTNVAVLKVSPPSPLTAVRFADSNRVRRGQPVIAMGSPFGLAGSATFGIVSARSRDVGSGPYDSLQIDAAINRGHSGGPVFDLNGEVVGMTVSIYSPTGSSVGIAFAVPSNIVREVAENLKRSGSVERGWLGIKIQNVDADKAKELGLGSAEGALVNEITRPGPTADSDLKVGDVIVKVRGKKIADSRDLARTIAELRPKERVDLLVRRGGKELKIVVELGKFPTTKELGAQKAGSASTNAPAVKDDEFKGLDRLE